MKFVILILTLIPVCGNINAK